jgi:uncharacterized protein YegP (UPF0339 family)
MAVPMAKFEVFKDKAKEWRWRLVHIPTMNIIADSGEGYKNKKDAINGFRSAMKHGTAALSKHLGKFEATFEWYQSKKNKKYYWRLRHKNGNIIADSGQGYHNKADALNGINSVKENAPGAPIVEV